MSFASSVLSKQSKWFLYVNCRENPFTHSRQICFREVKKKGKRTLKSLFLLFSIRTNWNTKLKRLNDDDDDDDVTEQETHIITGRTPLFFVKYKRNRKQRIATTLRPV